VSKQKASSTKGTLTKRFILIIAVLNVLDAVFTWILLSKGWAYEANPVVNMLLEQGPLAFFFVKIGAVSGVLMYMFFRLSMEKARKYFYVVLSVLVLYGAVNLLHLSSFISKFNSW
jgi:hypothetical protein